MILKCDLNNLLDYIKMDIYQTLLHATQFYRDLK